MKIFASGLSAAALLLSAGPSAAAVASAPPAARQEASSAQVVETAAELQAWMAEVAGWTEEQTKVSNQMADTLVWLIEGADDLSLKLEEGGPKAARSWAAGWAEMARDRIADDLEAYSALSATAPRFPASLPRPPIVEAQLKTLSRTSEQMGNMVVAANYASHAYIAVLERAASGEEADLVRLDGARAGLLVEQLEAETAMLEALNENAEGPNLHFGRVQISSNKAYIQFFSHNERVYSGEAFDASATAKEMRDEAADIRREVAAMRSSIIEIRADLEAVPGMMATPLGAMLDQVTVSLHRSADIEAEMADAIDTLAGAVLSGSSDAQATAWGEVEGLLGERLALDDERRALVARGAS